MRIISLSTIPPRFQTLQPTLTSLLKQSAQIDEIRLYIPKHYRRFPDYDGSLPEVPEGIKIFRPDSDLGPASKVLFAAQELRGTKAQILFCDDDKIFGRSWAQDLFRQQDWRPNECVALSGRLIPSDQGRPGPREPKAVRNSKKPLGLRFARMRHRIHALLGQKGPRPQRRLIKTAGYADIFQGLGGVVVQPEFFDEAAYVIPDIVWAVDDFWLSGMLARNNIPIWLPEGLEMPATTEAHDISSLYLATIEGARRSEANRACIKYMQETYGIWI